MEAAVEGQNIQGAIQKDESTGAVLYSELTGKLNFDEIRNACPYDIPRKSATSTVIAKCTMCIDRLNSGMPPACVKSCPTHAMNFGDFENMVKLAQERLNTVKAKFPQAQLTNFADVRVFYLVAEDPKKYHNFADASGALGISRKTALRKMLGPVRAFLHA
jgi:formate dehydrogenase iron-sulfur subunit